MKHLNLDSDLEQKKEEIMEQFNQGNDPVRSIKPVTTGLNLHTPDSNKAAVEDASHNDDPPQAIEDRIVEALKTIYDPEIPVNIYDLGLIYRVEVKEGMAEVDMTLTAPGCPVAHTFPGMVEESVKLVPGITDAVVELVWDPPWTQDLISEAARLELGLI